MATGKNSYTLNVDIKQRMSNKTPRFVQYDSAQIIFKIYDSGKQYDLTPFTSAIVTHRLPDGKTIAGQAEFTELNGQRVVVYDYMGSEMEQEGNIETSVGLFVGDTQKVSIMPFNVEIVDDLGDHIDEDVEAKYSVLQVMMNEVTELNKTMTTNESTRQSNEATRRSQEIQRQTNEDTRKSNENTRISNENTRKTNEDTRQSNETTRESNEATRKTDESGRVSAENTRKSNETTRQNQESGRVSAESTRVNTENTRISAEDTRKSNETARQSAETARSNAEKTRGTNEDTRKANETTRLSNEDERKTAETGRKSAEDIRVANETARVSAEDTRKANETERQKQEGIRNTAETERLSNENSRVSAENTRESQESTRQTQESTRQTNTNNAIARLDTAVDSTKLEFKAPVETKEALSTTYSNAQVGWVAQVTTGEDAGKFFRYNGSTWEFQSEIALDAVTDIQNKLHRTDRKTETLIDGVNIVDAPVASPTDIEIQGRTMVSLGNSNLEKGKYYALTDEKYKVITDGKTVSGVGKFQKGETHKTTADFKGKVYQSTTENPHTIKYRAGSNDGVLPITSIEPAEVTPYHYERMSSLDGSAVGSTTEKFVGAVSQQFFSFNVIEQVERTLGIIPGDTVAEKSAWLRTNANQTELNWYGYGTAPDGNKATLNWWDADKWISYEGWTHTSSTVSRIRINHNNNLPRLITDDGFAHFVAYAEPSDGVAPSTLYTDYISLDIELKPTAQLNTRPTIVRVENFEGKVSGSTVENPHTVSYYWGTELDPLNMNVRDISTEPTGTSTGRYERLARLDAATNTTAYFQRTESGFRSNTVFSFDLIEAVERHIGKIPAVTGSKTDWLRDNVHTLSFNWHGFGQGPNGSKAYVRWWANTAQNWGYVGGETPSSTVAKVSNSRTSRNTIGSLINDNGVVSIMAFTDVSDGVSPSVVHTDYIELEIHLKPTADFRQPRVPLYEVPKAEYDRIGVSQTDEETKRRYPVVQGVQHLVNPYVVNPGENLLPPFTDSRWGGNAGSASNVNSPLSMSITGTGTNIFRNISIPAFGSTTYTLQGDKTGDAGDFKVFEYKNGIYNISVKAISANGSVTWTTKPDTTHLLVELSTGVRVGTVTVENPMLTPGTEPKPFTPYNPSTLHAPVTLSAVGDKRDVLYQQDGRWYVRRTVREVELTGDMDWRYLSGTGDYNTVVIPRIDDVLKGAFSDTQVSLWDYTGRKMPRIIVAIDQYEGYRQMLNDPYVYINVRKDKMGGISTTIPESWNDVKRYFNGWKAAADRSVWESVTGNGQTATAEEALSTMPTDYTPYKLTYVLETPEVIDVTELVEGDIAVSGLTQIEVGAGEIVTEDEDGNRTYTRISDDEKHNVTAAPDNVKITYEQNIRSAHDALVNDVVQNTSLLSIHERAIVNLFARIRGLELSADEIKQDLDDLRTDFDNLPEPTPPNDGGTA